MGRRRRKDDGIVLLIVFGALGCRCCRCFSTGLCRGRGITSSAFRGVRLILVIAGLLSFLLSFRLRYGWLWPCISRVSITYSEPQGSIELTNRLQSSSSSASTATASQSARSSNTATRRDLASYVSTSFASPGFSAQCHWKFTSST